MTILVMGNQASLRARVAALLAERLHAAHLQLADDAFSRADDRVAVLRARIGAAQASGRLVVVSTPLMPRRDCERLRHELSVELVRIAAAGEASPPLPSALTVDGTMPVAVLVSTICAVLRPEPRRRVGG